MKITIAYENQFLTDDKMQALEAVYHFQFYLYLEVHLLFPENTNITSLCFEKKTNERKRKKKRNVVHTILAKNEHFQTNLDINTLLGL